MEEFEEEATKLGVKETYVKQGIQSLRSRQKLFKILLTHKKLPIEGWDDAMIEFVLNEFSTMDSNNFPSNVGVGEREGRVFSSLVSRRHYRFTHGIGRSGDIAEIQPKAAGSSLLYKLTIELVLHALQISGLTSQKACLVVPFATGMTLTMSLITLKNSKPESLYVIWPRIDQKSCFKSILTAGLIPLIAENEILEDGTMQTNTSTIRALMELHRGRVLCVLTTTSCFAPRQPDLVDEVARLCKEYEVGHVINNAYGLQCPYISKLINRAITIGRVDAGNKDLKFDCFVYYLTISNFMGFFSFFTLCFLLVK